MRQLVREHAGELFLVEPLQDAARDADGRVFAGSRPVANALGCGLSAM